MFQPYIEGDMDINTYYFTPLLLYHARGKIDNIYCMSTIEQSGKGWINEAQTANSKGYAESQEFLPALGLFIFVYFHEVVRRYNLR